MDPFSPARPSVSGSPRFGLAVKERIHDRDQHQGDQGGHAESAHHGSRQRGLGIRLFIPGIPSPRCWRRSLAIAWLERLLCAAGASVSLISPCALELPRVPEVTTLTTEETASGTAA